MMDPDSLPKVVVTDKELALMNAIARVFPKAAHLLCRWHIENNVFAKCRRKLDDKTWQQFKHAWCNLVHMPTISDYEQGLATLKHDFAVAKSAHKLLKGHLASSQGNFENAWAKMHDLVGLQIMGIKASFEKSLTCWQHIFKIPIFSQIRGAISQSAMEHMMPEVQKANEIVLDATSECNCLIRRTHGLPCAHEIAKFKNDEKVKTFNDKSQRHWMKTIKKCLNPSTTSLSKPQQKSKTKGHPTGSLNTSTRRDPSKFEYVEAAVKTPQTKEKTPKVMKVKGSARGRSSVYFGSVTGLSVGKCSSIYVYKLIVSIIT
ncbi:hypothetical protein Vadar_031552 [Vaccinium darrowii]|uniref:Uncharacterized protein n=1 Tax=Vaccinium darrowii TaxID=229202 RepID=A0ACB7Z7V4_9ERIC|nr:hypothetical protein Vadar_031552 [Vaccinium darrowii]